MKKRIVLLFAVILFVGCATPKIQEAEGPREYGLRPNQSLTIERVECNLMLNEDGILQIISLTDEQIKRLTKVLKALDPFGIEITQDMGKFDVEVLVEKESTKGGHSQTATTEVDAQGTLDITP